MINFSISPDTDGSFGKVNFMRDYQLNNLTNNQFALDMVNNDKGEIFVGGYTVVQGTEPSSFIFKTNSSGNEIWAKNYEETGESGYFISLDNVGDDGIYGIGGKWNTLENRRAFIMRADGDGELCNCFNDISISQTQLNGSVSTVQTQNLRPDWLFQFPSTNCNSINIPQRFCEQTIAVGPEIEFIIPKENIECDATSFVWTYGSRILSESMK